MNRIAFSLVSVELVTGVVAPIPFVSKHADLAAAPVFAAEILPGYRDRRLFSVTDEEAYSTGTFRSPIC